MMSKRGEMEGRAGEERGGKEEMGRKRLRFLLKVVSFGRVVFLGKGGNHMDGWEREIAGEKEYCGWKTLDLGL
jgi:hypothetical protein